MAGRADNNKRGSAGRGTNNQSNQAFIKDDQKHPKSDHNKTPKGGKRSMPSPKTADQDSERNRALGDRK